MLIETQHQQLHDEAKKWKELLRTYVDQINELKNKMYKWAAGKSDRDVLIQIERYHNQFHIQQINLHDLKQSIRLHMQECKLNPDTDHAGTHKELEEQFDFLIHDLDQLKADFIIFIAD
jgi:hypothetical protein